MSVAQKGAFPARRSDVGRQELLLALVFLVALGMRGLHVWGQARNNPFFYAPTMDEEVHHQWAQQIASGEGLGPHPFFRAPLYYYLLGGLYALFGPNLAVARLAGGVLGAVTCYLIARLGRALGDWKTGVLAGLIAAVYWPFIHFDGLLLTVGLETFLNVLLLLLLWSAAERDSRVLFVLSGIVWGLSALTRPTILALAPAIVVWLWVARRRLFAVPVGRGGPTLQRQGRSPAATALRGATLVFGGAAIAILPVTIRNRVVGGEWVLIASYGGVNFYIGNNPQADGVAAIVPGTRADWQGGYEDTHRIPELELGRKLSEGEVSGYWFRKGLDWIGANPRAWLRLTLQRFRLFWSPVEIPNNQPDWFFARLSEISAVYWIGFPVVACLGLASLGVLARDWRRWSLLLLYGLVMMATVVAFFCPGRYRLPFVPVLVLLTAAGLTRLPGSWRARRFAPLTAYAVCGGLAAVFLATNPPNRAMHWRETEGRGHYDLATSYLRESQERPALREEVLAHLLEAVRLRPKDPYVHTTLGYVFAKLGRPAEACTQLEVAVQLRPDQIDARYQLGLLLSQQGRYAAASEQFEQVLKREPANAAALLDLGTALASLGRYDEAAARYRELLNQEPGNAAAAQGLAYALQKTGRVAEAISVLRDALQHSPDDERLLRGLAWLLATATDPSLRDGPQAVALAERAAQLTSQPSIGTLNALAAALAETGQFERAISIAREALEKAESAGQATLIQQLQARLELYERGEAYREGG